MIFLGISDIIVQRTMLPTKYDWFLILKICIIAYATAFVLLISTLKCICICCKSALASKNCTKIWVVAVLVLLISILALDITPTIVLLFVFPTDTFSLLAIHIALFYTEVMVGTVFVRWLKCQSVKEWCQSVKEWRKSVKEWRQSVKEWCQLVYNSIEEKWKSSVPSSEVRLDQLNHDENLPLASQDTGPCYRTQSTSPINIVRQRHNGDQGRCNGCKALINFICVIVVQFLSIMACAIVYFPAIYFFQFLILRNTNNGAFDILVKYIPSIAIAFFGIFIRKKILQDKDG